jgi:cobalt/nickel transport system permease protein
VGYGIYIGLRQVLRDRPWMNLAGAFVGAWCSVFITSIVCAIELAASGSAPIQVALPAMASVHVLIGIGEGLITVAALAFITATRRDLITSGKAAN